MDSGTDYLGFKSWFYRLLSEWPWASYLFSLCLSLCIRSGISFVGLLWEFTKVIHRKHLEQLPAHCKCSVNTCYCCFLYHYYYIYSFNKYLFSFYFVPGIILGARNSEVIDQSIRAWLKSTCYYYNRNSLKLERFLCSN